MSDLLNARAKLWNYLNDSMRFRWDPETRARRDCEAIMQSQLAIMDVLLYQEEKK